jgi:hypothetical protein
MALAYPVPYLYDPARTKNYNIRLRNNVSCQPPMILDTSLGHSTWKTFFRRTATVHPANPTSPRTALVDRSAATALDNISMESVAMSYSTVGFRSSRLPKREGRRNRNVKNTEPEL